MANGGAKKSPLELWLAGAAVVISLVSVIITSWPSISAWLHPAKVTIEIHRDLWLGADPISKTVGAFIIARNVGGQPVVISRYQMKTLWAKSGAESDHQVLEGTYKINFASNGAQGKGFVPLGSMVIEPHKEWSGGVFFSESRDPKRVREGARLSEQVAAGLKPDSQLVEAMKTFLAPVLWSDGGYDLTVTAIPAETEAKVEIVEGKGSFSVLRESKEQESQELSNPNTLAQAVQSGIRQIRVSLDDGGVHP